MCPKAAKGTYLVIAGPDAYTASARAHSLSSCVPFGWVNFVCPVCVCSYLSTLISLISSESYGILSRPFCMVPFIYPMIFSFSGTLSIIPLTFLRSSLVACSTKNSPTPVRSSSILWTGCSGLINRELRLPLPLPPPRILNHLRANSIQNLLLQRPIRLQSLLPANMMTREVSELLVISTHLVEQAVARPRRARRDKPAIRCPKHVDNRIIEILVVQDER